MGHQPLSSHADVKLPGAALLRRQAAYVSHPDPATHAINLIAVVLALNGPFYPAYVIGLVGRAGAGSLLTMLVSPMFYAVPWISRRQGMTGRIALPVIGLVNTVWCVKLFGPGSGVGLFFIPCVLLAALLYRRPEVWFKWALIGAGVAALWLPGSLYGAPLLTFSQNALARLGSLNLLSVASLCGFIALRFAALFAGFAPAARPPDR